MFLLVFKSSKQASIEYLLLAMPYARSWEYNRGIQSCKQEMYNLVLKSQWEPLVILKNQKGVMDKAHILNTHWGSNSFSNFYMVLNKILNLLSPSPFIYAAMNPILDLIMIK